MIVTALLFGNRAEMLEETLPASACCNTGRIE
jgi:hypothetical protein